MLYCVSASVLANANLKITIEGVNNANIENNIRLLLQEVKTPLGRINEEKYKASLVQQVQKAVQAYGYYDAEVLIADLRFEDVSDTQSSDGKTAAFTVSVTLNYVAMVERVVLLNDLEQINQAALPVQIKALIDELKAMQGRPIDHSKYESIKNRLKTFTVLYGYFDFSFVLHKLAIQPKSGENLSEAQTKQSVAIIHWIFYLGERYKFGEVKFLEETRGQEIARNVKPFKQGQYFEQSKVANYSIDMQSTDYFSSAIARANAENTNNYEVPIEVILTPKPKDTFEFGVGVSTDTGPRFTVDWSRPWVNLDGHSLGATLYVSRPRQALELNYRIPMANPLDDFYNIQTGFRRTDENQTSSDTLSFSFLRQWGKELEDDWLKTAFIKFEQESFTQGTAEKETTKLLLPGFSFSRTRKEGEIFVTWGDLQQITVEGGSKSLLSDIDFFKVLARTKWIREYGNHRFLFRADAGAIATSDFDQVPSTQRFFAGGDQSIRGFGLNELSDFSISINEENETEIDLNGGKFLAVVSAEYAYPVAEKWRVATFIDAGNANDKPFSNPALGFGVGAHWLSPIGTVRFYLARGLSDIDNTIRFHLVIGPGL